MTITATRPARRSAGGASRFTGRANGCDEHSFFQAGCTDCTENSREYQRHRDRLIAYGQWRPALVDAEPVTELLRKLVATGWGFTYIAERVTCRISTLTDIAYGERKRVTEVLAVAVSDLYDELLCYPAPEGQPATYARNLARKRGWKPIVDQPWRSMVDVDEEIVRRAVRQENPGRKLGVAERAAALDHVVRVGRRNHVDAARVLGISARTVIRHVHRDPADSQAE